jgi:phosphoribosylformylglycinamidine synthase
MNSVPVLAHGRAALVEANPPSASRSPRTRSTTWCRLHDARPRPERHRADDVRAGQLRALPAQDLQRHLGNRRRRRDRSLFQMIKNTYQLHQRRHPLRLQGQRRRAGGHPRRPLLRPTPAPGEYAAHDEDIHLLCKVETHNHPTAISPYPGAATGSGGEIRDEGATGRGAKPKAGLVGFTVSNLRCPAPCSRGKRISASPTASSPRSTS